MDATMLSIKWAWGNGKRVAAVSKEDFLLLCSIVQSQKAKPGSILAKAQLGLLQALTRDTEGK